MFRPLIILTLSCTCLKVQANEYKPGAIIGSIGLYLNKATTDHRTNEFKNTPRNAYNLKAEGIITEKGALVISMTFMDKIFARTDNGELVINEARRLNISTGYRYQVHPQWSLALGFASTYSMGDPEILDRNPGTSELKTSASDSVDYGFDFSVRPEIDLLKRANLTLEFIYSYSVTAKPGEQMNQYGFLLSYNWIANTKN